MNYTNLQSVNPEIRAYIYQQLADLETFLPDSSAVSIYIDDKNRSFSTTIKIDTPFGEIQALEKSDDVYASLAQAKDNIVKQLGEIHRAANESSPEFDDMVNAIINKRNLH